MDLTRHQPNTSASLPTNAFIGGFVARSRPDLDPSPQTMRTQLHAFTARHPALKPQVVRDYAVLEEDGVVLAASDADVAVVAAHTARFALDALLRTAESVFPFSMYLIGLTSGWIFAAPFETIPLDVGRPEKLSEKDVNEGIVQDNLKFLRSLLPDNHGTDSTQGNPS